MRQGGHGCSKFVFFMKSHFLTGGRGMANQWFRLYAEFASDPKVQTLSEADQRRYIMLLCLRCKEDYVTLRKRYSNEDVCFCLRISDQEWAETKQRLMSKNLIDEDNEPTNWDKRQFSSDSSTARVRAHRKRHETLQKRYSNSHVTKGVTNCNALETETETETEAETKREKEKTFANAKAKKKKIDDDALDALLSHGVTEDQIDKFLDNRSQKKAIKFSIDAFYLFRSQAREAGLSLHDAMQHTIAKGWQSFTARYYLNEKGKQNAKRTTELNEFEQRARERMFGGPF